MYHKHNLNTLNTRQAGFTLIELLVAITILAIIAVMGWGGLDGIIRARTSLNAQLEQSTGAQISFTQLENDCAHIASEAFLPRRENLRATQNQLILVRTIFEDNQASKLQIVAYRLENDVLTRRESIATRDLFILDVIWKNAISGTDDMPKVRLQNEIVSMELRTWNDEEKMWRIADSAPLLDVKSKSNPNPVLNPGDTPLNPGESPIAKKAPQKTGLEVMMRLRNRENPLLKIFLLGAA